MYRRDGNCRAGRIKDSASYSFVFQFYISPFLLSCSAARPHQLPSSLGRLRVISKKMQLSLFCFVPLQSFLKSQEMAPTPSTSHSSIPIAYPANSTAIPQKSIFSFSSSAPRNYQARAQLPSQLHHEVVCCCCGTKLKKSRNEIRCCVAGCEIVLDLVESEAKGQSVKHYVEGGAERLSQGYWRRRMIWMG